MENKNIKILAIDDNIDNLITIKALIIDSFPNAQVATALSGIEGIELAGNFNPDVILLDVVMPGMDGFEVCEQIKNSPYLCDIPIVFVTALKEDKESRIRGLEVGAEAFLAKPIDVSELTAQIRAMLKIKDSNFLRRDENFRLAALITERTRELEQTHKATLNLLEDLRNENENRRRTEEELRRSEDRLKRAELASGSGNWELWLDEQNVYTSYGTSHVFGVTQQDFKTAEFRKFVLPEFHPVIHKALTELTSQNKTYNIEYKIKRADNNEIRHIHELATYNVEKNRVFGVIQDITEQKKMEEALMESEALHRAVLNSTPDNIIITDTQGKVLMISPSILTTYGYSSMDDIIGTNIKNYTHPNDLPRVNENMQKMLNGMHTGPHEYRSIKKDGTVFDLEVKGGTIRDQDDKISKLVFIGRDITERKKSEIKLIKSETEFRTVWENSASGLRLTDEEGMIIRVNDAYCKIFGKSPEELIGASLGDIYPENQREHKVKKHQENFRNRNFKLHVEKEVNLWNGEKKWVQIESSFLDIEGDKPLLLGIFTEITERKIAEDKIRHLTRLYALLGQVNQSIVRTNDPDKLLQKICDVAIEFGEFKMAWIGKYDNESSRISVLHGSGYTDGYLDADGIIIKNINSGFGPTTEAIKSNNIVCSNNIAQDNLMSKSRDEALKRGYKSLAVIPIHRQNEIFGTLNLYASEINFFNTDEQKLLLEIAEDISYALNVIDAEQIRKQAEENLIESENRYNSFVNNNVDMIFVKDENRRYLIANQAMANFFNKNIKQILNKTDNEIADNQQIAPCASSDHEALKSDKAVFSIEKLGERYFESTKFRMPLKNGKIGIGGILHDITNRRNSEKALEESRLELKAIYDNAPVMLCVLDENKEVLFQNNEFKNFVARSDEKIESKLIGEIVGCINTLNNARCGEGAGCNDCVLHDAIEKSFTEQTGQRNFEYKSNLLIQGERRDVYLLGSTAFIHTAGKNKLLITLYDITSRKNAEEALQKSEMFLRTFIDNTPFQIWARDDNNIGIMENKLMIREFGSIIGKKPTEDKNIEPEIAQLWEKQNDRVINGELINEEIEYTIRGKKIHFQQIIFPVYVNDKVVAIAGFDIDITDRIQAQQALRESQLQLKDFAAHLQNIREEERVVLAREIHDELGQILVAIKIDLGLLGIKAEKYIRDEASAEFMEHFNRLSGQVNNTIKTARRIMSNLRPEVLDILGFVDAVKSYLNTFSERHKIKCSFESEIADFNIDSQHSVALFRIIQESLNNTAKHAFASEIVIHLGFISDSRVFIEVIDNGKGFDISQKKRSDSYGIIGMKERAYLIDADFQIISEAGKGTTIRIEIPYTIK